MVAKFSELIETRTWDDAQGITLSLRGKEEANDYRYFPDPDLTLSPGIMLKKLEKQFQNFLMLKKRD